LYDCWNGKVDFGALELCNWGFGEVENLTPYVRMYTNGFSHNYIPLHFSLFKFLRAKHGFFQISLFLNK